MAIKLILLRGNSGSGKSTVAKALQYELGYGTMCIPQDVVRREILRCKDVNGNPSMSLIDMMVRFGWKNNFTVILEGILPTKKYEPMLRSLIADCPGEMLVYYFTIPFEETLRRHFTKPNAHEFGEKEMREWWYDDDRLRIDGEICIDESLSQQQIVAMISQSVRATEEQ